MPRLSPLKIRSERRRCVLQAVDDDLRVPETAVTQQRGQLRGDRVETVGMIGHQETPQPVSRRIPTAVTGAEDRTVRFWDLRTGLLAQSLRAPGAIRTVVAADADGVTLLAGRFLLRLGR